MTQTCETPQHKKYRAEPIHSLLGNIGSLKQHPHQRLVAVKSPRARWVTPRRTSLSPQRSARLAAAGLGSCMTTRPTLAQSDHELIAEIK